MTVTFKQNRELEKAETKLVLAHLELAGDPVVSVFDGAEWVQVGSQIDALSITWDVDEAILQTRSGGRVLLVYGEGWEELICNYSMSLEPALRPVFNWIATTEEKMG